MLKKFPLRQLILISVVAAVYSVLTIMLYPLSYGIVQIRFAEALTILPALYFWAVPAVTLGCLIANIFSPYLMIDIIFGTLATFIAAVMTYKLRKRSPLLSALPPVFVNAFILPIIWYLVGGEDSGNLLYFTNVLSVTISQAITVYGIGLPLYYAMKKIYPPTAFEKPL